MNEHLTDRSFHGFFQHWSNYRKRFQFDRNAELVFNWLLDSTPGLRRGIETYDGCALQGVIDELEPRLLNIPHRDRNDKYRFHQMIGAMTKYIVTEHNYVKVVGVRYPLTGKLRIIKSAAVYELRRDI